MNRLILYKINIILNDGSKHLVTVACSGKEKLPEMYEKNKWIYADKLRGSYSTGFEFVEEKFTIQMSKEQYDGEIMYADLVESNDEIQPKQKKGDLIWTKNLTQQDLDSIL
jgi:hypothetical protein